MISKRDRLLAPLSISFSSFIAFVFTFTICIVTVSLISCCIYYKISAIDNFSICLIALGVMADIVTVA
jgi:hypothetical protein